MVQEGHNVGNHSYSHAKLHTQGATQIRKDLTYFGEFGVGVAAISGFLVFIFYLPSQILLCFSGRDIMTERDL